MRPLPADPDPAPAPARRWDVAVVGLGTAGAAAAILLQRLGHRVTVLEQAAEPSALGAGIWLQGVGQQVLDRIGLLDELRDRSTVVSRVSARTTTGRVVMDFGYHDLPGSIPALGVHRGALFDLLTTRLDRVTLRTGTRVDGLHPDDDGVVVSAGGRRLGRFDLVIGADGRDSGVREALRLTRRRHRYPYGAVWSIVEDPQSLGSDVLYQCLRGTGECLGVLPTGRGQASIFWSVPERARDAPVHTDPDRWRDHVAPFAGPYGPLLDRVEHLIPARYDDVTVRRGHRTRRTRRGSTGAVVIGDAAHAMSPQLGVGTSLALADAWSLAVALSGTDDLERALETHRRDRAAHVRFCQWATRAMMPLFQSDLQPLALPRDALALPVSVVPPARRTMVRLLSSELTSPWTRYRLPEPTSGPLLRADAQR